MSKVVLITGCSSGFGYLTAKYLAGKGFVVIPTVRKEKDLKVLPNTVLLDVTWDEEKINAVINKIIKQYKRIDVLINNAGYGLLGKVEDISAEVASDQMETNFIGPLKMIRSVIPTFKSQESGLIINISSVLGLFSIPEYGIYSASKFALEAMSQALRLEVEKYNIKIAVVNPGAFKTKFNANAKSVSVAKNSEVDDSPDPKIIGELIHKIIDTPNPKQNYLVGKEALQVRLLTKLPSNIKNYILRKYST